MNYTLPWVIFSTEVLFDSLTMPFSILNFYMLYTMTVIHRNLKFILLCQSVDFMLRSSIKVFITFPARLLSGNIFWFERQFPALQFIFFGTITFRMLLGHVIVLERMLATIYAKDYEHYKKNTFTGVWFSVVIIIVCLNSASQVSNLKIDYDGISTMLTVVTYFLFTVLSFLEIGVFALLWLYNKRKFANYRRRVSLAERYQLLENVRTTLQLVPALCLYFLSQFNSSFIQGLYQFYDGDNQYGQNVGLHFVNMNTSMFHMLIEISIIIFHPVLNRRFRFLCARIFALIGIRGSRIEPNPKRTVQMEEDICVVTEKYFKILREYWQEQ